MSSAPMREQPEAMDGQQSARTTNWLCLFQQLLQTTKGIRHTLARMARQHAVTDAELMVLFTCGSTAPLGLTQKEMAVKTGVSPAQMSNTVETLRESGLLSGRRSDQDRRRVYWVLTADGQESLKDLIRDLAGITESWSRQFPLEDQSRAKQLLERLSRATAEGSASRYVPPDGNAETGRGRLRGGAA